MADGTNAVLLSVIKGMGSALPDDFKRRGRLWVRESDGIRQVVGLRRLMLSYGTGGAAFRLTVNSGVAIGNPQGGGDWYIPGHHWWVLDSDADVADVERVTAEVRLELPRVVECLDARFSQENHLAMIAEFGNQISLLNEYCWLERLDDARALVDAEDFHPPESQPRESLWGATVVVKAYEMLGSDPPPEEWQAYAVRAVKAFRGRPPKDARAQWEYLRAAVDRWSA